MLFCDGSTLFCNGFTLFRASSWIFCHSVMALHYSGMIPGYSVMVLRYLVMVLGYSATVLHYFAVVLHYSTGVPCSTMALLFCDGYVVLSLLCNCSLIVPTILFCCFLLFYHHPIVPSYCIVQLDAFNTDIQNVEFKPTRFVSDECCCHGELVLIVNNVKRVAYCVSVK